MTEIELMFSTTLHTEACFLPHPGDGEETKIVSFQKGVVIFCFTSQEGFFSTILTVSLISVDLSREKTRI